MQGHYWSRSRRGELYSKLISFGKTSSPRRTRDSRFARKTFHNHLLIVLVLLVLILVTGCGITGLTAANIPVEENKPPEVYFCTQTDCFELLESVLNSSFKCAFYTIKPEFEKELIEKGVEIVKGKERTSGLMHNKFCTENDVVITGSWNPTKSDAANSVFIIYSRYLAKNYLEEFYELKDGEFGKGEETVYPVVILNNRTVQNGFCPEDGCKRTVIDALEKAEKEILFMQYSFTDDGVGDLLIEKARKGVAVKGVFDSSQITQYSEYEKLKQHSVVKKKVHHKVFVIDEKTVVLGSANPSNNGFFENDENILIAEDSEIARQYKEEFNRILIT